MYLNIQVHMYLSTAVLMPISVSVLMKEGVAHVPLHCLCRTVAVLIRNVWFQKISIPPPQRVIGNSEGEGDLKGQNFFKESMSLNWNFQRGGVSNQKKPLWGEYGYFLENVS